MIKTQSLENTPTGAFSMLKLLVMLSLGFKDEGFYFFNDMKSSSEVFLDKHPNFKTTY